METKSIVSSLITACAVVACLSAITPVASAGEGTVTSVKSFPSYTQVHKNLTAEATSTDVEHDSNWGGIETLDVPQTQSQAEKDAAAAQKAAEESAAAAAKAEAQQQEEAQQQAAQQQEAADAASASRNQARSSLSDASASVIVGEGAAASVNAAYGLIGQNMDCTALVTKALAARGINFHGSPAEYVNIPGSQVVTDGTLQPGDVLIWSNSHVALYVGNGQAIHGGWNGYEVRLAGVNVAQGYPTSVVRIP